MSSAELRENRTLGRSASGDGRKRGTSDCADEVTLSRKGANGPTRARKLRSTGTKAKARVSNRPNSLSELKKQLEARARELAKVREQQTATSEVLRAITGSPGDVKPVFEVILTNARRLCEAKFGHLLIYDGERFCVAAMHAAPSILTDFLNRGQFSAGPATGLGRLASTKRVVHVADLKTEQAYLDRDPLRVATVDGAGARTGLAVPMLKENKLVGAIVIYRQGVRPFTDKQIELVTTFADQAAIAIENVRRLDEIQDKSRQLAGASEHKSQFVASISHELRTPLNAIIGLTEMMVTNATRFGTEKAQEPLQRVNRAGTHLLGLINQVLDLSKIGAGKLEFNPQTVQLAPLINEVIGTAGQLAEKNKNRLAVDAQENLGVL